MVKNERENQHQHQHQHSTLCFKNAPKLHTTALGLGDLAL